MRHEGKVKWFDAKLGYGFITPTVPGVELFVHYTGIDGTGYRTLQEGDLVEFDAVQDPRRNGLRAENVRVLTRSAEPKPVLQHRHD